MNGEGTGGPSADRREFLRSIGRAGALALAGLAAARLAPRGRGGRDGQTCVNRGVCTGCDAFDECVLPAAISRKAAAGPTLTGGGPTPPAR